jgi:hypothetical protein
MTNFRESGIILAILVVSGADGVVLTSEHCLETSLRQWIECFQACKEMIFDNQTYAIWAGLAYLAFAVFVASKYLPVGTAFEKLQTYLDKLFLEPGARVKKKVSQAVQSSLMRTFNHFINQWVSRLSQANGPDSSEASLVNGKNNSP